MNKSFFKKISILVFSMFVLFLVYSNFVFAEEDFAVDSSTNVNCSDTQYKGASGCSAKIKSGDTCGYDITKDSTHVTCISGYCNPDSKKCEDDVNCTGKGKYQLTTGLPFFGFGKGQCIDVDTGIDVFLSGLLKFILGSVATITVIIIIIAGFMWSFSAGNKNTISKAREMITNAVVGLVLTLTCGLMLQVINPNLLDMGNIFNKIHVDKVVITPGKMAGMAKKECATAEGRQKLLDNQMKASNIVWYPNYKNVQALYEKGGFYANRDFIDNLNKVFGDKKNENISFNVDSVTRTVCDQINVISKNCISCSDATCKSVIRMSPNVCVASYDGCSKCNPQTNTLPLGVDGSYSGHLKGIAIDVFASEEISKICANDVMACRKNPKQRALIEAFLDKGFCLLDSEAWHFEYGVAGGFICDKTKL